MSDFNVSYDPTRWGEDDFTAAANYKGAINSSASANTKGSWAQFVASAPFDVAGITCSWQGSNATAGTIEATMMDIGIGGAGSEQVLVPNIFMKSGGAYQDIRDWTIPLSIPAGTRIAARSQSTRTSAQDVYLKMQLLAASFRGPPSIERAEDQGTNTSNTTGTVLTAGTTNAKGAWAQITASTNFAYTGVLLCMGAETASNPDFAIDLGIGAGGSEQVVVSDLYLNTQLFYDSGSSTGRVIPVPGMFYLPLNIPAATRVAGRCKCTTNAATISCTIVGFS